MMARGPVAATPNILQHYNTAPSGATCLPALSKCYIWQVLSETFLIPKQPPSAPLRAQLREQIISRIAELKLDDFAAAE